MNRGDHNVILSENGSFIVQGPKAHPTGWLLLAREPYATDMVRIIEEANRFGVAIELNAHPYRLDIDWRLCKYVKERRVKIAINPDAHEENGLKDTYYGVEIGRKGWLSPVTSSTP
jgi:DNA polymerase (family 10)